MFKKFYTTEMSGNKKTLQNRFSKIRAGQSRLSRLMAVIMTVAILATTACATIVIAATQGDGLEHLDKNQVFNLAGMKLSIDIEISAAPQWVKDISSDGKLSLFINRVDIRDRSGLVTHSNIAIINGDLNSAKLRRTSTSGYVVEDVIENSYNYMFFTFLVDEKNNIDKNNIYAYFTTNTDEFTQFMGVGYNYLRNKKEFEKFSKGYNIEFIGNFEEIEKEYNYGIYVNYFTHFENNYNNHNVSGIDLSVAGANTDYITIKTNINIDKAKRMQVFICEPYLVPRSGTIKPYVISEINGTETNIENMYPPKKFESGKTYAINYVVTDEYDNVLYRQQDYVTIK